MTLFRDEPFVSHAGKSLAFKIDCDALTDEDIDTLAHIVAQHQVFSAVIGVPRGGLRLAKALEKYRSSEGCVLIVDDVLTTGMSMGEVRASQRRGDVQGIVIVARAPCPSWVKAIFNLSEWAGP